MKDEVEIRNIFLWFATVSFDLNQMFHDMNHVTCSVIFMSDLSKGVISQERCHLGDIHRVRPWHR